MVPDRNDNTPDLENEDENGLLTETGSIDTTGIALFASTETVSFSMPVGSEDDDFDAEDAVDAIVADEIVVDLGLAPVPAVEELAEIGETGEIVLDEPAEITADAGAAADAAPHDAHEDIVDADIVETADIEQVADIPQAVEEPAQDASAIEVDLDLDAAENDDVVELDLGDLDAEGVEAAEFEIDVDDDGGSAGDAASDNLIGDNEQDPVGVEAVDEGTPVNEVNPMTDPLSREALRKAMEEQDLGTEIERTRENERNLVARPQEVTLTSKRVGEFEPDRESADLLTADRLLDQSKVGRGEPEGTWQHFVYSISGKRINLGDSKRAKARKDLDRRIAAPLTGGARFIPVLSRKGGVGKTTITALLGMALADARDDRVIAIDANPDRGTLAERIARPSGRTVRDLARLRGSVNGFNDISTIVARDETRLDVISSDSDPHVSEAFSDHDYRDVAAVAAHYYSLVLTDTGTGIVHSVMGATLDMSDEIVIVAGLSVDEARLASETLTWLEANGFADKVRRAVVVLNNSRPGEPLVLPQELEAHFRSRVRAVVRMPYDPHIGGGGAITYRDLDPATREAARQLAAIVVEGLRSLDAAA